MVEAPVSRPKTDSQCISLEIPCDVIEHASSKPLPSTPSNVSGVSPIGAVPVEEQRRAPTHKVTVEPPRMKHVSKKFDRADFMGQFLKDNDHPLDLVPALNPIEEPTATTENNVLHDQRVGNYTYEDVSCPAPQDITAAPARPKRANRMDYSACFHTSKSPMKELSLATTSDLLALTDFKWFKLAPSFARTASGSQLPTSYNDIAQLVEKEEWYAATDAEIASLIEHDTWKLVPPPSDRKAIKCKWVFRIKTDADGNVTRYKARLCACGYSQIHGLDYKEIYAPVVRGESLRLMLAIVASRDMELHQMDVVTAFLNGNLEETIYMNQPPGYVDPEKPNYVCSLHKNLYGLKQAPRVWHKTIDPFLKSIGFCSIDADPCVYFRWTGKCLSLISLYVDDLAIASDSAASLKQIKVTLASKFKMTDEGELTYILGMKVRRNRAQKELFLSNEQKVLSILKDFNMDSSTPVSTPMESVTISSLDCPEINSSKWLEMQKVPYRECVGRLTYLMRTTRPDIAFAISVVNRYLQNPGPSHWNAVKRILRYLKGTSNYELRIAPLDLSSQITAADRTTNIEGHAKLTGNVDADWAGDVEHQKSTSGYGFFLGSSLVSWSAKAQSQVATSSTHAEYIAAYHATTECLWTRTYLINLGLLQKGSATTLYCDNEPAIKIAQYHMVNPRSKHFEPKYHFVRQQLEQGTIQLVFCAGKDNVADIFTKPLGKTKFTRFTALLGLGKHA
jgi:hypothetical protein